MLRVVKKIMLVVVLFSLNLTLSAKGKYDFGDQKSATLTGKAWASYEVKDWKGVEAYTEKCIALYSKHALKQQAELTAMPPAAVANSYWALNDVGTCYFIKAKAFKEQGKMETTKKVCQLIIDEYSYAQCWDIQGWFWQVASASKDLLSTLNSNIDFEDYTSETLTTKAWQSLNENDVSSCIIYAEKSIALYVKDAKKMQESLANYASKEKAFDYWALNDVGTCYFILGEAYSKSQQWEKAVEAYQKLINDYFYAQCWDSKGWFWKPAVASRGKLNKIMAEQGIS